MPIALVTGGTGQVGRHVIARLVRDGWTVRALVRDPAGARALDVELVQGDVLDAECMLHAARVADVIFHAAAVVTSAGGWEAYRRPNIDGTKNVIAAAAAAHAKIVHVSSVAVYGNSGRYSSNGGKTHEDVPLAPLDDTAFYARSKRESEALVLDAHRAGRIWATALRPDVIYGRYDRQFVPRMARMLRRGFAPVVGSGLTTLPIVHAENVAEGIVRAASVEAAGGRAYNLANDFDVTVDEFFTLAAQGLNVRVHKVRVPYVVAQTALGVINRVAPLFVGSKFRAASSGSLGFLTRDNPFTSERARAELGWNPTVRPEVGIPDAFRSTMPE